MSKVTFRVDEVLAWSNPVVYTLETSFADAVAREAGNGSNALFYAIYAIATSIIYLAALSSAGFGNYLYAAAKREDRNGGAKIIVRLLSIILVGLTTIGAVPILTILLQGYQCEEDSSL